MTYGCVWCDGTYEGPGPHGCEKEKKGRPALDRMKRVVDVDWTTWCCPCGSEEDNRSDGNALYRWALEHAEHVPADTKCEETFTTRAARYIGKED